MNPIEIAVTLLIGTYAMVGGALLNASITSPQNAKKILDFFTAFTLTMMVGIEVAIGFLIIIIGEVTGWFDISPSETLGENLIVWFGCAHFLFEIIIYACKWITKRLL